MTREQAFWANLNKEKRLPGIADRVENVATPGFFDVSGTYRGHDYWVELKAPATVSFDVAELLETSQKTWSVRRYHQGARNLFVFVKNKKNNLYLYKVGVDGVTPYFSEIWRDEQRAANWLDFSVTLRMELL